MQGGSGSVGFGSVLALTVPVLPVRFYGSTVPVLRFHGSLAGGGAPGMAVPPRGNPQSSAECT